MWGDKTIIYVGPTQVIGVKVENGELVKETQVEKVWSGNNLVEVLKEVKAVLGGGVIRVLAGERWSYMGQIRWNEEGERLEIAKLVEKQMPEDLEKANWDYKIIDTGEEGEKKIQVMVIGESLSEQLKKVESEVGWRIEAVETTAGLLAERQTGERGVWLHLGIDDVIVVIEKGVVVMTKMVDRQKLESLGEELEKIFQWTWQKHGWKVEKLWTTGVSLGGLVIEIETVAGDPRVWLAEKKIKGSDEEVLNVVGEKTDEAATLTETKSTKRSGEIIKGLMAGGLFLGVIVFWGWWWKTGNLVKLKGNSLGETRPTPTLVPTKGPSATRMIEPREVVKIKVLNGSGIPGKAGELAEKLKHKGYKDIETGNAPSYEVAQTQVKIKPNKKNYLELVFGDVKESYEAISSLDLGETETVDVVVIIGRK